MENVIESWKINGDFFDGTNAEVHARIADIYGKRAQLSAAGSQGSMQIFDVIQPTRDNPNLWHVLGRAFKYEN